MGNFRNQLRELLRVIRSNLFYLSHQRSFLPIRNTLNSLRSWLYTGRAGILPPYSETHGTFAEAKKQQEVMQEVFSVCSRQAQEIIELKGKAEEARVLYEESSREITKQRSTFVQIICNLENKIRVQTMEIERLQMELSDKVDTRWAATY